MTTIHALALAAVAALLAGAANAAPISSAEAQKIIAAVKANEAQWNADVAARDAAKFAAHYADNATMMDPFATPLHGRAAIEAAIKSSFADPGFSLSFAADSAGVSASGDLAWTQGHCVETETDPASHAKVTNPCAYVTIYHRNAAGGWVAIEDIASPIPRG